MAFRNVAARLYDFFFEHGRLGFITWYQYRTHYSEDIFTWREAQNKARPTDLIRYAPDLMREVTIAILRNGGGLVIFAGSEPFQDATVAGSPALIFDWTVLEIVDMVASQGKLPWPHNRPPIVVVTSGKAASEIPAHCRALWEKFLKSGLVRVEYILPGARSGALLRERQAQFGNVLIWAGGGTGVEHLADLYHARHKPIIRSTSLLVPVGMMAPGCATNEP